MKRNLNIKVKLRDGTVITEAKKEKVYADFIVPALDAYGGNANITSREIAKLADKIDANIKPPKETELSPEDAKLIIAAMEGRYISIVVRQIADYLEAK